jgi:uncharacterized membrane protein HdeD (DUF308 family)
MRGVVAVLFGILTIVTPEISLTALLIFFAAFVLLDGVFSVISAVRLRKNHSNWWYGLLRGLAGIVLAIFMVAWPGVTAVVLLYLIAAWLMLLGAVEMITAVRLRRETEGEIWILAAGLVTLAIGLAIALRPKAGVFALAWIIGLGVLVHGLILITHAWRVRRMQHQS